MNARVLFILFFFAGIKSIQAQRIPHVKKDFIDQLKANKSDTVYVVNFWATWCQPCVKELPAFEKLNQHYTSKKLKVILVSTDFKKQFESRLKPFVLKHHLRSTVLFMSEANPNDWIDRVDPSWSGAIPATLIISGKSNTFRFMEGETTYDALEKMIKPLINE